MAHGAAPIDHKAALLFLNGGLGNGLILGPVLRGLEKAIPGLTYFSPPNAMLEAEWVRAALGLLGPQAVLPPLWRRFLPTDRNEIITFARSVGATLVINLRKEAADRDPHYFAFRTLADQHGIECWDLHELTGDDLLRPIGQQAALVLRRHGVPVRLGDPAWLRHLYRPGGVIGLSVGASTGVKRWPIRRWSSVITALHGRGHRIEIFAGPDEAERDIARQLAARHGDEVGVRLPTSITALRDWVAGLDALISNDTLTVHLAAALGCPVVALYLATDGRIWSPVAAPGTFSAVQSQGALRCVLMKVDGTCHRYYDGCAAPCGDHVTPEAVLRGLDRLLGVPADLDPDLIAASGPELLPA